MNSISCGVIPVNVGDGEADAASGLGVCVDVVLVLLILIRVNLVLSQIVSDLSNESENIFFVFNIYLKWMHKGCLDMTDNAIKVLCLSI